MSGPTYGALFAGYGGLEMGVQSVLGGELGWYAEIEPAPSRIMAHHHPEVPNLGDVTKVDWTQVEPVDVITGGSPCQDLSHAGKRAGMRPGTRSGLWASMCDAIDIIRPSLVVWENVRGALSAEADSAVDPCPLCVGDGGRVTLRALGRVLGDLAELGYDARWYGLRAADVGAPHGRFRIFLFATPSDADGCGGFEAFKHDGSRSAGVNGASVPHEPDRDALRAGPDRGVTVAHLLPTPTSADSKASGAHGYGGNEFSTLTDVTVRQTQDWREYGPAIRRWESVLGRPAPTPTTLGAKGQPRLSADFVEFMMGLPAGYVTDPAIGINRNDQLKALGNGVVLQQCAAATRAFIHDTQEAAAC